MDVRSLNLSSRGWTIPLEFWVERKCMKSGVYSELQLGEAFYSKIGIIFHFDVVAV